MTSTNDATPSPAPWQDDAILWQHKAFCGLALPARTPRGGAWSRAAGGINLLMGAEGAAAETLKLPSGRLLRLLLLHVFTSALRGGGASVALGADAAAVADSLGLEATPAIVKELGEQAERLVAAKLRVAAGGRTAALSVLDARRSGSSASSPAWRPVLHLTERFFASLQQDAVALDRGVVAALAGSAAAVALDAYAWLAAVLPAVGADQPVLVPWAELQLRFGHGGPPEAGAFRAAFTDALAAVRHAWTAGRFTVGEDGVELLGVGEMAAVPAPEPIVSDPVVSVPVVSVPVAPIPAAPAPVVSAPVVSAPVVPSPEPAPQPPEPVAAPVEAARPEPSALPEAVAPDQAPAQQARPAQPTPMAEAPAPAPAPRPHPAPPPMEAAQAARPRGPDLPAERDRSGSRIRLAPKLTGLGLSVWLRSDGGDSDAVIEVTPGPEYNPARRSLFILEPLILQVEGSLRPRELEQVSAWVAVNAELIQDYWNSEIPSVQDVVERVKRIPSQRW